HLRQSRPWRRAALGNRRVDRRSGFWCPPYATLRHKHRSAPFCSPGLSAPRRECEPCRQWSVARGLPEEKSPCRSAAQNASVAADEMPATSESESAAKFVAARTVARRCQRRQKK